MSISLKLKLAFAAMFVFAASLGISALYSARELANDLRQSREVEAKKLELSGLLNTSVSDMLAMERAILLRGLLKDAARQAANHAAFVESAERAGTSISALKPLTVTEEGKRLIADADRRLADWGAAHARFVELTKADTAAAERLLEESILPVGKQLNAAAERYVELQQQLSTQAAARAESAISAAWWRTGVLVALALVVGIVGFFILTQITRTLTAVANDMSASAEQVAAASGQVSSASQSLAQGASEQASSVEETSASTEEVNAMTRHNVEGTASAREAMRQATGIIQTANGKLEQMVASMSGINAASEKIAKIIKVIDEIAFQTNILALNAAVEAARAGDAGMGFAVVADEVRTLAQRSAQAAKDTAELIEASISTSREGNLRLQDVTEAIAEITSHSARVQTMVEEIAGSSQEQAKGLEQISLALSQVDQVTQRTAATAEEAASSSEELAAQAQTMNSAVARLQQLLGGAHAQAPTVASAHRSR